MAVGHKEVAVWFQADQTSVPSLIKSHHFKVLLFSYPWTPL